MLALSSLATSVEDQSGNVRDVRNHRVVDILLLASLEVVAVAPWTVSETELAAFLSMHVSKVLCWIRLCQQVTLSLLDCVHYDGWSYLNVVFV